VQRVFHYQRQPGYNKLVGPGDAGLEYLEFGLLRVPRDEQFSFSQEGREAVLVILSGACTVQVDGQQWDLERVSVFAGPAVAVYVPRHRRYTVTGVKPGDLAVFQARSDQDYLPRLIEPGQTPMEVEGAGGFRRRVFPLVDEAFPASRLLVGETFVESGQWASYPPHKHDEDRYPDEVRLEEAAFFQIDPPQGFALQYLYSADRALNQVYVLGNDDAFAAARGYHPLAAAPGYQVYYLWGMAGDGHVIRSSVDPAHAWVAAETGAPQPIAVPE
jgi:5-deoxy-glucuronate isomerase